MQAPSQLRTCLLVSLGWVAFACSDSTGPPTPGSLTITPADGYAAIGGVASFEAHLWDKKGNPFEEADRFPIAWSLDDPSVASSYGNGNFQGLSPGVTTVRASAAGLLASATIHVQDNSPPSVSVSAWSACTHQLFACPASGTVQITVTASDDHAVNQVSVYADETLIGTKNEAPWVIQWNTQSWENRTHYVTVKATDPAGNVGWAPYGYYVQVRNPTTVRVQNLLSRRVWVEANDSTEWVSPRSTENLQVVVMADEELILAWEAEKPTTSNGTPLGLKLSGVFDGRVPDEAVEGYTIDNVVGGWTYYFPMVTNATPVILYPAIDIGLPSEVRPNVYLQVGLTNGMLGYYTLHAGSRVGVYNGEIGYGGPYKYYYNFSSYVEAGSGDIRFTFTETPSWVGPQQMEPEVRILQNPLPSDSQDRPLTESLIQYPAVEKVRAGSARSGGSP